MKNKMPKATMFALPVLAVALLVVAFFTHKIAFLIIAILFLIVYFFQMKRHVKSQIKLPTSKNMMKKQERPQTLTAKTPATLPTITAETRKEKPMNISHAQKNLPMITAEM